MTITPSTDDIWRDEQGLRGQFNTLNRGLTVYGATKPWNMPWGVITSASSTSDQTGITGSFTDVTFATASWTGYTGRLYRINANVKMQQVTSTGSQFLQIQTGASGAGTALVELPGGSIAASSAGPGMISAYYTGSGTLTAHLRAATTGGTLTIQNTTYKGWFIVEDLGPTAAQS